MKKIRFGDFAREVSVQHDEVSYNDLIPKKPLRKARVELRSMDVYRLLKPYISTRFSEQLRAVIPLAVYLVLFQIFVLQQSIQGSSTITAGLFAVIVGLMLFMEGLKLGLMPFGESIGTTLPTKSPLWVVLFIAFLLGVGVTFAEPAIGALKAAGAIVSVERAPYLYELLNNWTDTLVLVVGGGVGLAAILGTLRFIYGWSLKPMIYFSIIPTLFITFYVYLNPDLRNILGLAWDCGAVTTGPVTVPLVLSLGIGVASSAGKGRSSLSGFGIVTLASVFPILGVLILGIVLSNTVSPQEIIAAAQASSQLTTETASHWTETTPGLEIVSGMRSIVPLVLFLFFVMKIVLRERVRNAGIIIYGITLAVAGMIIFNLGLTYGLAKLGGQSGGLVPAAFTQLQTVAGSPIYSYSIGLGIAILFAWFLGFGATLAEPALNALGITVENLTNGAFKKSVLLYAVSIGVACGIGLGVAKLIFDFPLFYLLIPLYAIGLIFTFFSSEEYVNVAWDSAGVTTGPVTVPLVLAMGLGFGNALNAIEGFGILSMASICPIIAVLTCGIWIELKAKRKQKAQSKEPVKPSNTPGVISA